MTFKFVDRRRVDESGEPRSVESEIHEVPQEPVNDEDPAHGPVTFSLFLQSLAHQTLTAMGVIPWPGSEVVQTNLDQARETIDILTILHEKTKGNLTASEQRFFDTVLYELRVTFVKLVEGGKLS